MKHTILGGSALATLMVLFTAGPALAWSNCLDHRTIVVTQAENTYIAGNKCKKAMKKNAWKVPGSGWIVTDFQMECEMLGEVPGGKYWYGGEFGQCICSAKMCKKLKLPKDPDLDPPIGKLPPEARTDRETDLSGLPSILLRLPFGGGRHGHGSRSPRRR